MTALVHPGTLPRVRIIAGALRGRVLRTPRGRATRPTADRVREALFSILGDVSELDVLDLFAGSGALGLEALSRGASYAVFVEEARAAQKVLEDNLRELEVEDRSRVLAADAHKALGRLAKGKRRFGLVFLDPPYARSDVAELLEKLAQAGVLLPGAWIVLEHAARDEPPKAPVELETRFRRDYGDTALTFYRARTEDR